MKRIGEKSYYVITTAEELAWFAAKVNDGEAEINALLANDIQFKDNENKTSAVNWASIGRDSTVMFKGTFDGAGYTVYGLCSSQSKFAGLFGVTASGAVVKNLNMAKDSIVAQHYDGYAGGIVALNNGLLSGCTNMGKVFRADYSGGISGQNTGTISTCTNSGAVSGYYPGGIVGRNAKKIDNCMNFGKITASLYSYTPSDLACKNASGSIIKNGFSYGTASVGIVYKDSGGTVTNAYYDSGVLSGKSTVSPNLGKTSAAMQKDRFAWILNTTNGTEENGKIWSRADAYPIFADEEHLPIYKIVFDDALGGSSNRYTDYKGLVSLPDNPEPKEGYFFVAWLDSDGR